MILAGGGGGMGASRQMQEVGPMALSSRGAYAAVCARIASLLQVSLGAARQQIDRRAAREGARQSTERLAFARNLLVALQAQYERSGERPPIAHLLDVTVASPSPLPDEE